MLALAGTGSGDWRPAAAAVGARTRPGFRREHVPRRFSHAAYRTVSWEQGPSQKDEAEV